jgi:hypothetical protein
MCSYDRLRLLLIYCLASCFALLFLMPSSYFKVNVLRRPHVTNRQCPAEHFSSASGQCHAHLNCDSLSSIRPLHWLVNGTVKHVRLARWHHDLIVMATPSSRPMSADFSSGLQAANQLDRFQATFTTEYLGRCDDRIMFTRYAPLGDCLNAYDIVRQRKFAFGFTEKLWLMQTKAELTDDRFKVTLAASLRCFQLCLSYVRVISDLHSSPIGTLVMCDGNSLGKLLTQFLFKTPDQIVLNDLDALPDASRGPIRCGSRALTGDLIAPEQRATNATYDEKIDIWRIPDVCLWFLNACPSNNLLQFMIRSIFEASKQSDPYRRPSARSLLNQLRRINHTLFYDILAFY